MARLGEVWHCHARQPKGSQGVDGPPGVRVAGTPRSRQAMARQCAAGQGAARQGKGNTQPRQPNPKGPPKMDIAEIDIEGTFALLMNNPLGMKPADDSVKAGKKVYVAEDEAEASAYRAPTGQLFVPSPAFRGALLSAAKGRKIGKPFATQLVKGSVFPADEITLLRSPAGEPAHEFEIDARRCVVGKAGITRNRAKLSKWAATVRFEYDNDFMNEDHIRTLLDIAGRTVGVGDYRPEKSGPFGRFRLV